MEKRNYLSILSGAITMVGMLILFDLYPNDSLLLITIKTIPVAIFAILVSIGLMYWGKIK